MKLLSGIILLSTQLMFLNPACALDIKNRAEFLKDVRSEDGNIYLNRISLYKNIEPLDMEISGFGETQWNIKTKVWEKMTAGFEAEKCFFKYLYAGQSIQYISGEILDFMTFSPGDMSAETTTKLSAIFPVFKNSLEEKLFMRFWEEYSYNLEKGAAGLNEVGIEFNYNLKENICLGFGWRHTDRIHNFDTDYCSSSFSLKF
jgi:hypothetical protein